MTSLFLAMLLAAQSGSGAPPPPVSSQRSTPPATTMVFEPIAAALAAWDVDGDGRTTRAEMVAGVARSFTAIEPRPTTPLGYIGYSDWAERYLGDRHALPSPFEVDTNGDDKIGLDELQAAVAAAFDRFDRDHDGVVTRAELLTIRSGLGDRDAPGKHGKRPPR